MIHDDEEPPGATPGRARRPVLGAALQHPLAVALIGFLLTGVLGTTLTNHYASLRRDEEAAIYQRDTRRKAVLELGRAYAELLVRADLLAAALARKAPQAVLDDHKQLFDAAVLAWATKRPETLLLAREVVGEADFNSLRADAEARLARKRMGPALACLERAYAEATGGGDGAAIVQECEASRLLAESHPCSEAITDVLYELSSVSHLNPSDQRAVQVRAKARQTIEQACP